MLEKLKLVEARYLEMAERAAQPDFYNDPKAASQLLKEQRQLEPIITAYRRGTEYGSARWGFVFPMTSARRAMTASSLQASRVRR